MKISDLKSYTVVSGNPTIPSPQQKTPIANKVANFFGAKGISDQFGASLARTKADSELEKSLVENPTLKQVAGSAIQTGANFLPGAGVGAKLATKAAIGAGTGYALDVGSKLQNDTKNPLVPGVGTAIGTALPGVGAGIGYAGRVVGRLFKGLGSGLSGVSTETINKIVSNPKMAQVATDKVIKTGNAKVLEENARQIMNGVSTIRKEARKAFGEGLETLAKTDIEPTTFRAKTQAFLDKYGSTLTDKGRKITNAEFDNPKNLAKANELIGRLNSTDLDGKSLRKLANDIESAAYKTTGSDAERLSFNAFVNDLSDTLKEAITGSTDKFGEINKKFSSDMQLTKAIEDIFGKVKFKNLPEVVKATKKLETLFAQKGIAPEVIDDFFTRIGVSPQDFKTTEAVRQIMNKEPVPPNTPGFNVGEVIRTVTGAILTPETINRIAIKTGLTQTQLNPLISSLKVLSPALQKTLIQALLQDPQ